MPLRMWADKVQFIRHDYRRIHRSDVMFISFSMPSLRKRVSSYLRQLSFNNDTRERRNNVNENTFVTKYLQGCIAVKEGPPVIHGKNPTDLPSYDLGCYDSGPNTIIGCYSGPNGGLTTIKRVEKHLSVLDPDIDFIDKYEENGDQELDTHITIQVDDSALPTNWNKRSDFVYGISDSLYDRNQVTNSKNGDPIADCFGIIARNDSAIIAVADGVNWGEKASIAAKSAVHGSLHYLNKTIFNDTKPFENLTVKAEDSVRPPMIENSILSNTREVFVCLLRAFNCAHDLILENQGMLTTLTVSVVLPLKQELQKRSVAASGEEKMESETQYVCCTCNVGDTLAYVYSQKYGIREITKGSHDVTCSRDMRDALGALGPVDGINPELSNLTLSITTLHRGDIVLVASDGMTDNFDPNVCKYTVTRANAVAEATKPKRANPPLKGEGSFLPLVPAPSPREQPMPARGENSKNQPKGGAVSKQETLGPRALSQKPPVKPLRRFKNREPIDQPSEESNSLITTNSHKPSAYTESKSKSFHREPKMYAAATSESEESHIIENIEKEIEEPSVDYENPLVAQFMKQNSVEGSYRAPKEEVDKENVRIEKAACKKAPLRVTGTKTSSLRRQTSCQDHQEPSQKPPRMMSTQSTNQRPLSAKWKSNGSSGYRLGRSKTSTDMRPPAAKSILRNEDGVPYITPLQRYELQLLLMEDVLNNGISGQESSCRSAKKLCENLVSYTMSITSAKRHTLEDKDLYFDSRNGMLFEVSNQEKKLRRKKRLEAVQNLPGKLDHVTVAAYNVGHIAY
nr:unnamed protein product [Callosobruchus chinensis]